MPPVGDDRSRHGGGLLVYIKKGVPAREASLETSTAREIEVKPIDRNLMAKSNG